MTLKKVGICDGVPSTAVKFIIFIIKLNPTYILHFSLPVTVLII